MLQKHVVFWLFGGVDEPDGQVRQDNGFKEVKLPEEQFLE